MFPPHLAMEMVGLVELTEEEAERLEAPYTPPMDIQAISDPKRLERIFAQVGLS